MTPETLKNACTQIGMKTVVTPGDVLMKNMESRSWSREPDLQPGDFNNNFVGIFKVPLNADKVLEYFRMHTVENGLVCMNADGNNWYVWQPRFEPFLDGRTYPSFEMRAAQLRKLLTRDEANSMQIRIRGDIVNQSTRFTGQRIDWLKEDLLPSGGELWNAMGSNTGRGSNANINALRVGGKVKRPTTGVAAKWLPTSRTVKHKGAVRKLWRSAKDAAVQAVKRIVKAADGTRKVRYERV